jgi:hypothetical protein
MSEQSPESHPIPEQHAGSQPDAVSAEAEDSTQDASTETARRPRIGAAAGRQMMPDTADRAGAMPGEPDELLRLSDDEQDEPAPAFYLLLGLIVAALLLGVVWVSGSRREESEVSRPAPRASSTWSATSTRPFAAPSVQPMDPHRLLVPHLRAVEPPGRQITAEAGGVRSEVAPGAVSSSFPRPDTPPTALPNSQFGTGSSPSGVGSPLGGLGTGGGRSPDWPLETEQSGPGETAHLGRPTRSGPVTQGYIYLPPPGPAAGAGDRRFGRPPSGAASDNPVPAR